MTRRTNWFWIRLAAMDTEKHACFIILTVHTLTSISRHIPQRGVTEKGLEEWGVCRGRRYLLQTLPASVWKGSGESCAVLCIDFNGRIQIPPVFWVGLPPIPSQESRKRAQWTPLPVSLALPPGCSCPTPNTAIDHKFHWKPEAHPVISVWNNFLVQ